MSRNIIALTLYYDEWICECIDIKALFLEGDVPEPNFLEWPPGMVLLGLIDEDICKTTFI